MGANMRVMGVLMGKVKEIPTVDATLTKSGFAADAKVVGDKLNKIGDDLLSAEDVVNDLESDAADKPLSAAMGKVLREMAGGGGGLAENVIYDNSESGLDATDVQRAITLLTSMARNALPLEGGTLTGENIYMDSGRTRIQGNEDALLMQALNGEMDNQNRRLIGIYNSKFYPNVKNAVTLEEVVNGKKLVYGIYGEHNKKSGTYTGDGASSKTVETDSIGKVVFVIGSSPTFGPVAALVCDSGSVAFNGSGVEIKGSAYLSFRGSGKLVVKNSPAFNDTGATYSYYVL